MCGRFILGDGTWAEYHEALSFIRDARGSVSYNIKPTEAISIALREQGHIAAASARWWFVPHWFRDDTAKWKATTFNARIESAADKPVFRAAWRANRCLVPASGYYEWTGETGHKQPWYISVEQNVPVFFFAGLYAARPDGSLTCAILTRAADPEIAHLHPRMPIILTSDEMMPWLDREMPDVEAIDQLGTGWTGRYIARRVRPFGIADDGPELIEAEGLHL